MQKNEIDLYHGLCVCWTSDIKRGQDTGNRPDRGRSVFFKTNQTMNECPRVEFVFEKNKKKKRLDRWARPLRTAILTN